MGKKTGMTLRQVVGTVAQVVVIAGGTAAAVGQRVVRVPPGPTAQVIKHTCKQLQDWKDK